jgi:hypothetical protein
MEKEEQKNTNSKRGKKARAAGVRFEAKVRQHLEGMGWIVGKWTNTVDYEKLKLIPAKRKYNPFFKALGIGTGFPDFVAFKRNKDGTYEVVGVEVKGRGYLDKIEKGMCHWLLDNKVFSRVLIARKGKERGEVSYWDFHEKYGFEDNKV